MTTGQLTKRNDLLPPQLSMKIFSQRPFGNLAATDFPGNATLVTRHFNHE
jgi:hypothetical protein